MTGLRERRHLETKQLLVETAFELFVERGFENVALKDIARAADVSTATLFAHFPQKESLLMGASELLAQMRDEAGNQNTMPVQDALRAIGMSYARRLDNAMLLGLIRMGITLKEKVPGLGQAVNDAWRRPFIAKLEPVLDQGMNEKIWLIPDRAVAIRQFLGAMTDALLWPRLFAMIEAHPPGYKEAVVEEALKTFNARYKIA